MLKTMPFSTPIILRQMLIQGSQMGAPSNGIIRRFASTASSATPKGLKLAFIITMFTVPPLIFVAQSSFDLTKTLTSRPRKFEPKKDD